MKSQNTNNEKYPIPTVGGFILNKDNKILLVKSYKWKNCLTVPGGKIQLEETLEKALKREIKEELGLEIKIIKIICTLDAIYPKEYYRKKHFIFHEFLCWANEKNLKIDNNEIQSFEWVDLKEALKRKLDPFTRKVIKEYIIPYINPS